MTARPDSKLFQPIEIGHFSIKNRIIMPAMLTCFATPAGTVTNQMVSYYSKRAEGGVGLIIVEGTCVDDPVGRVRPYQLCVDHDRYIEELSKLALAVHSAGGKIALQLHHAGPNAHFGGGAQRVAPSSIPLLNMPDAVPRELDLPGIQEIIGKFVLAAKRARKAGYDAVELMCAHGYLLNRFLSPHANRRNDGYGSTTAGRTRIVKEIIEGIRAEVGKDLSVLCKVNGTDYVDGGITPEESVAICRILENAGADALTVSGGSGGEGRISHFGMGCPPGWLVPLAQIVKQEVSIPVAAIGKIKDAELAEAILTEGKADLIAVGRGLIAEPDFAMKARRRENERMRPCIYCNHCLDWAGAGQYPLRCSVNPSTGREYDMQVLPADRAKKVLVVGGGPAGMQTALAAASRGHKVVLLEKTGRLGGQLLLGAAPPGKDEVRKFADYLSGQLKEKGVEVKLNTPGTREAMESANPEVVVLATGAVPAIPQMAGVDLQNVITAWDALMDPEKVRNGVVIVGGGLVGCEVARFLHDRGRTITIVEQLEEIGLDIGPSIRKFEIKRLQEMGITMMAKARAKQITKDGVVIDDHGKPRVIMAETVVLAVGSKPDRDVLEALETAKVEVHAIGDGVVPRRIVHAVSQGFRVGNYI